MQCLDTFVESSLFLPPIHIIMFWASKGVYQLCPLNSYSWSLQVLWTWKKREENKPPKKDVIMAGIVPCGLTGKCWFELNCTMSEVSHIRPYLVNTTLAFAIPTINFQRLIKSMAHARSYTNTHTQNQWHIYNTTISKHIYIKKKDMHTIFSFFLLFFWRQDIYIYNCNDILSFEIA